MTNLEDKVIELIILMYLNLRRLIDHVEAPLEHASIVFGREKQWIC